MINDIVRLDTYKQDKIIYQKLTLMWLFGLAVMHSMNDGEHYTFCIEFGPIQFDFTLRFWAIYNEFILRKL